MLTKFNVVSKLNAIGCDRVEIYEWETVENKIKRGEEDRSSNFNVLQSRAYVFHTHS